MNPVSESEHACPFCASQVEKSTFAEAGRFRAIYNISPILPGHSLVLPKAHKTTVLELSDGEICEFALFAQTVTRFLQDVFKSSGFNWTIQDGESAGQTIAHLHLHLIPRSRDDLPHPGDWYPLLKQDLAKRIDDDRRKKLTPSEMAVVVAHLRDEWRVFKSK